MVLRQQNRETLGSAINFIDVTDRLAEPQLREILADSVGHPSAEKLAALATQYAQNPLWSAHALFSGPEPFGVIGLEVEAPGRGRIRHIAVARQERRSGVGRRLIEDCREALSLSEIRAATDSEAIDFYARCGFTVRSLGENDHGVERFECLWREQRF